MAIIQVVGNQPRSGKTSFIGALLNRMMAQGQRSAYYKQFSPEPSHDPDVAFFEQQLLTGADAPSIPPPEDAASPVSANQLQKIGSNAATLQQSANVVVVEGPDLTVTAASGLPLANQVAEGSGARTILIFQYAPGLDASQVVRAARSLGERLAGIIINGVTHYRNRQVDAGLIADLRSQGLPLLGAIPEDRTMLAVTVQEIANHLNGRWLQEPVNTDVYIGRFLIGNNIMDSGISYLGRYPDQALIVRAERPDIQLASLGTDTRCLVLTGGEEPTEYVQVEARKKEVPIVLVEGDTMTTSAALESLLDRANPYSRQKIERFNQLMQQSLDLDILNAVLG